MGYAQSVIMEIHVSNILVTQKTHQVSPFTDWNGHFMMIDFYIFKWVGF